MKALNATLRSVGLQTPLKASVKATQQERQNTTLTFLLGLTIGIVLVVGVFAGPLEKVYSNILGDRLA